MQIIVEGPDASGKTTLIRELVKQTGLIVTPGLGPEIYPGEIFERLETYRHMEQPMIFDRHPAVSHTIYSQFTSVSPVEPEHVDWVYSERPVLFIYCSGGSLEHHEIKPNDSFTHLRAIELRDERIREQYKLWGDRYAHLRYNIDTNDDPKELSEAIAGVLKYV